MHIHAFPMKCSPHIRIPNLILRISIEIGFVSIILASMRLQMTLVGRMYLLINLQKNIQKMYLTHSLPLEALL